MCAVCHGASGEGYTADQAPALANVEFLASVTDTYLAQAITNGRAATTMSAWGVERGGPLAHPEVDAIVAFLRTWEHRSRVALEQRAVTGDAARGADLYARECLRCHGASGVGGPNVHIGNVQLLATASDGFLRYAIRNGRPQTAMPGFAQTLGDTGIEDTIALLRKWQSIAEHPSTAPRPMAARAPPIPIGPVPLHRAGPEPVGFRAYPAMTPADVIKAQLDRGARFGILDARAPSDYTTEHIAGAVSVPFYDPEPYFNALPKDAWLVCYCGCPHAESGTLAQKLSAQGFTRVTVLDEGLGVWKARKYETRIGLEP